MYIEEIIDQKNTSFDYIVCPLSRPLENHYFVAIATWITPNVILTARHVLNGFTCDDIKLLVGKKLYSLALLEDGADYDQDYALLYVEGISGTPIKLTLQSPNEGSSFGCPRFTQFGEYAVKTAEVPYSQHYSLLFESNLGVLPGASGAPYINMAGEMFGLHLSGYQEHSIWAGITTGISLKQMLDNLPPGKTWLEWICTGRWFVVFSYKITKSYFFDDDFCKSCPSIGQIDHRARNEAFGGDNDGLGSLMCTQVLLRYFLKGKAKPIDDFKKMHAQFFTDIESNSAAAQRYYSYRDQIDPEDNTSQEIFKIFSEIKSWTVSIKMPINGNLKDTQYDSVELDRTREKGKKKIKVAAIQMGHKMGACDYWAYGAGTSTAPDTGWLKSERIPQISLVKYDTPAKLATKIKTLEQRYKNYQAPGHSVWPLSPTKTFMSEHWNFHFQWWQINQRDGTLAGKKTPYEKFTPPGYKWVNKAKAGARKDLYLEKI